MMVGRPGLIGAWSWILLLLWTMATTRTAKGQLTTAVCGAGFDWANNTQGLSACSIASNILGPCSPTPPYTLPALSSSQSSYPGPSSTSTSSHAWNRCLCSIQAYNILAACSDCQGKSWANWTTWTAHCGQSYTGDALGGVKAFPEAYPTNVSVPPWVEYDSTMNAGQTFDPAIMQSLAARNLSSSSSSGGTPAQTLSTSTTSEPQYTPTSTDSSTPKSDPATSAIVGGVVGGIAVLGLFGGMLWFMFKRARRNELVALGILPPPPEKKDVKGKMAMWGGVGEGSPPSRGSNKTPLKQRLNKPMEDFLPPREKKGLSIETSSNQYGTGRARVMLPEPSPADLNSGNPLVNPSWTPNSLPAAPPSSSGHSYSHSPAPHQSAYPVPLPPVPPVPSTPPSSHIMHRSDSWHSNSQILSTPTSPHPPLPHSSAAAFPSHAMGEERISRRDSVGSLHSASGDGLYGGHVARAMGLGGAAGPGGPQPLSPLSPQQMFAGNGWQQPQQEEVLEVVQPQQPYQPPPQPVYQTPQQQQPQSQPRQQPTAPYPHQYRPQSAPFHPPSASTRASPFQPPPQSQPQAQSSSAAARPRPPSHRPSRPRPQPPPLVPPAPVVTAPFHEAIASYPNYQRPGG